jgi:HEAT repeats
MNSNPALTISLLSQLTDRELQSNYLNYLDRTPEIASLLAQITDKDLALRIVNLALEVDLNLGASLTASLAPELQEIVVRQIDRLEINLDLKIELWCRTKSKATLPYLHHLQESLVSTLGDWETDRTIKSVNQSILNLEDDLDLDLKLLMEDLYEDPYFFGEKSLENLTKLAPEATEVIGDLLLSLDFKGYAFVYNSIDVLHQIGTPAAIAKIRDALYVDKSRWSSSEEPWTKGLAIVAEPAMVEHLIYLLHFLEDREAEAANRLCLAAIEALEYIGGDLAFEILHRSLYWIITVDEYRDPFDKIVETLFRLDRERTLTAMECAIHSYDLSVRKRAIIALSGVREMLIEDRNLTILLDALNDPEVDVQLEIVTRIREIGRIFLSPSYFSENSWIKIQVDRELLNRAYAATHPILIGYLSHSDLEVRQKAISVLRNGTVDENMLLPPFLVDASERDILILTNKFNRFIDRSHLPILLKYLEHERIELRAYALTTLGTIGDDSILPILIPFLNDSESIVRESAVSAILRLGTHATLPVLLELATNRELVTTMVSELQQLSNEEPILPVFEEFLRNPDFTRQFIETAETTLIEIIENDEPRDPNILLYLGWISITDRSVLTIGNILKSDRCTYEDEDGGVNALEYIGTDLAINTLLELLPNKYVLGGWIANVLERAGKLGIIPHLWLSQRQWFSLSLAETIDYIQTAEGLYNPDFSDRDYPLFQPADNLRRKILPV